MIPESNLSSGGCTLKTAERPIHTPRPLPPLADGSLSVSSLAVSCRWGRFSGDRQLSTPANTCSRPIAAGYSSQTAPLQSSTDQSFKLGLTATISAMNRRSLILFALSIVLAFRTLAAPTQQERADWSSFFATALDPEQPSVVTSDALTATGCLEF